MSSKKDIVLYERNSLSFSDKFYLLMDILVSNQSTSRSENVIILSVFYLQFIFGFFDDKLKIFNKESSHSDEILFWIEKIIRVHNLLDNKYNKESLHLSIVIILLLVLIFGMIYFLYTLYHINKKSFYSFHESFLNYSLKIFLYIAYSIILDYSFSYFCFNDKKAYHIVLCIVLVVYSTLIKIFIHNYYNDTMLISSSFYAKVSSNYDLFFTINSILFSFLKFQTNKLTVEFFCIYNICISIFLWIYYYTHFIYYDSVTNTLCGIYHLLYVYTSIFSFLFFFIDINEKGIVFFISSLFLIGIFIKYKERQDKNIILKTPYYRISNKYYVLYYLKALLKKLDMITENEQERALVIGIIQMHMIECPNEKCIMKNTKDKLYLPLTQEWSHGDKQVIHDRVFLIYFILSVMSFFISQNFFCADMLINISYYYLKIIGNYCLCMYYYKKVKEMELSTQEKFEFKRLSFAISKELIDKLKTPNEACYSLEDLNVSYYFKYEELSTKFYNEMYKDVNYLIKFWKSFSSSSEESLEFNYNSSSSYNNTPKIDFNQIFELTNKIRLTKKRLDNIWEELFDIYNGINENFDLYLNYIENINDDDAKKRDLEAFKRKTENSAENYQLNFYNILFGKETGVMIVNGDKGKEGVIEKVNNEIENIFLYTKEEMIGMNISQLMPRIFESAHKGFMEHYYQVGEKTIIDNKDFKTYAKDKNNSIMLIKKCVKLFPILNNNVFFVAMIQREKINDIIFINDKFIIEGISSMLKKKFMLNDNNNVFVNNKIPFYVICKKFINFYKIFILKNSSSKEKNDKDSSDNIHLTPNESGKDIVFKKSSKSVLPIDKHKVYVNDNIEINENIELEYEIKIPKFLNDYVNSEMNKNVSLINNNEETGTETPQLRSITNQNQNTSQNIPIVITSFKDTTPDFTIKQRGSIFSINNNLKSNFFKTTGTNYNFNDSNINLQLTSSFNLAKKLNQIHQQIEYEEKEFFNKLNKYQELFEKKQFDELEDYIDYNNIGPGVEFKFNFTFDRYRYGKDKIAYVIRCIDSNKADNAFTDESSRDIEHKENHFNAKEEIQKSLIHLNELLPKEREGIINERVDFLTMAIESKIYQEILNQKKQEIMKNSRIIGTNNESTLQIDENASQASTAGFNDDLCRRNRIEEIKTNTFKNIHNFYTLNYIKLIIILVIISSIAFYLIYFLLIDEVFDDLITISNLNIVVYQTSIYLANIISSIISMRTIFMFNNIKDHHYVFRSYLLNNTEYFNAIRVLCFDWYEQIMTTEGMIWKDINKYVDNSKELYWKKDNVSYNIDSAHLPQDTESFQLGFLQIMDNINDILKNYNYNASTTKDTIAQEEIDSIEHNNYMVIENAITNLLPNQVVKLEQTPKELEEYANNEKKNIFIEILIYFIVIIILIVIYSVLIYLTNKNMGEGFEMITKIKQEKITEIIQKLEIFKQNIVQFLDKDTINALESQKYSSLMISRINEEKNEDILKSQIMEEEAKSLLKQNISQIDSLNVNQNSGYTSFDNNNVSQSLQQDSLFNQAKRRYGRITSISGGNNLIENYNMKAKKQSKRLSLLTFSYFQIIFIIIDFVVFLSILFVCTSSMIEETNHVLKIESYFLGKSLVTTVHTINIKCEMSHCDISSPRLNFSSLISQSLGHQVLKWIPDIEYLNYYYEKLYMANACKAAFNITEYETMDETSDKIEKEPLYIQCMNDVLIKSGNNTEGLHQLIENKVHLIRNDIALYSKKDPTFSSFQMFSGNSFYVAENAFYRYMIKINDNFEIVIKKGLKKHLEEMFDIIVIIMVVFACSIILIGFYIGLFHIKKLIQLLSISHCVVKIIPTNVINNTQELENWIENKY